LKIKSKIIFPAMILIAASLLLTSCINFSGLIIKGSGEVITREFDIKDFDSLNFSSVGKIEISQGEKEALIVEAEDNIVERLDIEVKSGTLYIGMKKGFAHTSILPTKDIIFKLTVRGIKDIKLSGAGSINGSENIDIKNLDISSSGLGNVNMKIAGESVKSMISGAGKIDLEGKINTQEIHISGLGSYNAENMPSNDCKIIISGAGNAKVNVVQSLDVSITGLGSVEYSGSPSLRQNISGGGNIKSID
jgi:hypothetical protein